jgi:phospholipid-translocating ATPase
MEFQKCSVNGVAYGEGITEAMLGAAMREGRDTSAFNPTLKSGQIAAQKKDMVSKMQRLFKNRFFQEDKLTLVSPKLVDDMSDRSSPQRQCIINFFRALALCHSVLADRPDPDSLNRLEYKAESPDEAALVAAARDVGFPFLNRSNAAIEIEVMGQPEKHQPLRLLEFNSTRKRMSVVVRTPEGRILLICKGADSVIYQRLRADHDVELKERTAKDLEDFANAGLRTLCIAYKYVSEEAYENWVRVYDAAAAATVEREEEIEKACEFIEFDLTLLGATALEDKLQVGVPEAIAQLRKAGIKLWILTGNGAPVLSWTRGQEIDVVFWVFFFFPGDKLQTAIEIGKSW